MTFSCTSGMRRKAFGTLSGPTALFTRSFLDAAATSEIEGGSATQVQRRVMDAGMRLTSVESPWRPRSER